MSVEQVKAFVAKVKDDSELAQKLKDAQANYTGDKGDKEAAFAAVVLPIATAAGFKFNADDFKAAFGNDEGEASEDELDAVAGGGDPNADVAWELLCPLMWDQETIKKYRS